MQKFWLLVVLAMVASVTGACTKGEKDQGGIQATKGGQAAAAKMVPAFASFIRGQHLSGFNKPIGKSFEDYRYFDRTEWQEVENSDGKVYVDFTGWLKDSPKGNALEIKFVIYPGSDFYVAMISRVDITPDGKVLKYPLTNKKSILQSIFDNKRVNL